MSKRAGTVVALLALGALMGGAMDVRADPVEGRAFAERVCGECHAVLPGDELSPLATAPPFAVISANPVWTRRALTAWFQTSHPSMPNLILEPDERDNVIDYILGLGDNT